MAKITKKEYSSRKAEIQMQITEVKKKLQILSDWNNTLNYNNLSEYTRQKLFKIGDYWNGLHDRQRELEQELKFLDDKWETRNWTGADWNSWDLVTSNID